MYNDLIVLFLAGKGEGIMDSLPIAIYATDKEGRLVYFNSAAVKLSGREPELVTNRWPMSWELYYPDGTPMPYEECPMAVSLEEGRSAEGVEMFTKRPDGEQFWFRAYSSQLSDKVGEVIGSINLLLDITDQKEAENRIWQQKRLYEAIIDSTPDLVYVFNLNYRVTFANEALLEMWGLTREESIGKTLLEVGYEQWHAEIHEREFGQVIATKLPVQGEVAFPHAKLGRRMYDYILVPVIDEKGGVEAVAGTTRDITNRKKAGEALRRSEEKYRTLFKTMDDGFVIIEILFDDNDKPIDFLYLETNPASDKQSGLGNRVGKKASEVLPDIERHWIETYGNVALTGEPVQFENYMEELQRWFDVSAFRIGEPEERKVAVLYKNITERKQARKELKAMNETLEERVDERTQSLLSYQNQLRSLASQLNRAEEKQREQLAAELHDNLGQLLAVCKLKIDQLRFDQAPENFEELEEIIDDALKYTRELMSDLKPPPSIEGDLKASLGWVTDKIEKHGLKVTIDDDNLPKPLGDEVRGIVVQCVRELLFNVLKHTSEKEAVVILRTKKNHLHITVKDNGEGFGVKNLELIPEEDGRFGLFNIRERLDLMGGDVTIEAEPGKGTKVTLYVPLAEENKVAGILGQEGNVEQTVKAESGDWIKVLIVDDHQMFREGIRKIVEEEDDIKVIGEAADGKEAISLTRETIPDIILMDINMPVMDGIEATRQISSEMPNIRIIGLSLYDGGGIAEDMRNAGAAAYLTKTEAFESLIGTIRAEASSSTG